MSDSASNVYADDELAALYDLVYDGYDDDLPLYEHYARRAGGPALEMCVGSGRVALPLARLGLSVVGLDASPPMLERLRSRLDPDTADRLRLVEADMRRFDLGERFGLVYCAFGSFEQLLTTEDQLECLRTVAAHVAPGGAFVAELRAITAIDWEPDQQLLYEWTRPDPTSGEPITKLRSLSAAPSRQVTVDTIIFDRQLRDGTVRRRQIEVVMRAIGRFEIEHLLDRAGLRLAEIYGDTSLSPYTDTSDSMIIIAEPVG